MAGIKTALKRADCIRYDFGKHPEPTGPLPRHLSAMIRISQLAASVQPSATLAAGAKARELRAKGVKVFDFSLG